jgi:hypothetical protein
MAPETVDLPGRVAALEHRVTRLEGMIGTVTRLRADLAAITVTIDPALTAHVAELDSRVERHALLLARLLDATPLAQRDDDT